MPKRNPNEVTSWKDSPDAYNSWLVIKKVPLPCQEALCSLREGQDRDSFPVFENCTVLQWQAALCQICESYWIDKKAFLSLLCQKALCSQASTERCSIGRNSNSFSFPAFLKSCYPVKRLSARMPVLQWDSNGSRLFSGQFHSGVSELLLRGKNLSARTPARSVRVVQLDRTATLSFFQHFWSLVTLSRGSLLACRCFTRQAWFN